MSTKNLWQSYVIFSIFIFFVFVAPHQFYFRAALAGREGGFRNFFYYPHAAWPTVFFLPPNAGGWGIENGSCLQNNRQRSRHHQQVKKPLTYSFARIRNCELAMTPDQSIQGMRKKEIKYQRDLSKIGLWTILICEYGVFCKYIYIYNIYIYIYPPSVGHLI